MHFERFTATGEALVILAGDRVGDPLAVYLAGELVVEHLRPPQGTRTVTLPEHAEAVRADARNGVRWG